MQFKSLSHGHFPLNLLGMSARRQWVRAGTAPRQFLPECAGQDLQMGEAARIRDHGDRQRARIGRHANETVTFPAVTVTGITALIVAPPSRPPHARTLVMGC